MGVTDWFSGVKCADCGKKIEGPRVSRVILATQCWVCNACEEKFQAKQKSARVAEEQRRQQESAAAVLQRSDEDIAEALQRIVLNEYLSFARQAAQVADGAFELNHIDTFGFVLTAVRWAVPADSPLRLNRDRMANIEAILVRYAFAGFIRATIRNPQPSVAVEPFDRAAMLVELDARYRNAAEAYGTYLRGILKTTDEKDTITYFTMLGTKVFFKPPEKVVDLLLSDKEKFTRLLQCISGIFRIPTKFAARFELELAALNTRGNVQIAIDLPSSWLLRQTDPWLLYRDPCTPQYNLLITVNVPASSESPVAVLNRVLLMNAPDAAPPVELGANRAMAQYRIAGIEAGQAKDDRHWLLAEREAGRSRYALFTLSVLSGCADSSATDALVDTLSQRIQQARFLA
jgi:hypothetical protein